MKPDFNSIVKQFEFEGEFADAAPYGSGHRMRVGMKQRHKLYLCFTPIPPETTVSHRLPTNLPQYSPRATMLMKEIEC